MTQSALLSAERAEQIGRAEAGMGSKGIVASRTATRRGPTLPADFKPTVLDCIGRRLKPAARNAPSAALEATD